MKLASKGRCVTVTPQGNQGQKPPTCLLPMKGRGNDKPPPSREITFSLQRGFSSLVDRHDHETPQQATCPGLPSTFPDPWWTDLSHDGPQKTLRHHSFCCRQHQSSLPHRGTDLLRGDSKLQMEEFPNTAICRNASSDFSVPDTAAAATGIATGAKVPNGRLCPGPLLGQTPLPARGGLPQGALDRPDHIRRTSLALRRRVFRQVGRPRQYQGSSGAVPHPPRV